MFSELINSILEYANMINTHIMSIGPNHSISEKILQIRTSLLDSKNRCPESLDEFFVVLRDLTSKYHQLESLNIIGPEFNINTTVRLIKKSSISNYSLADITSLYEANRDNFVLICVLKELVDLLPYSQEKIKIQSRILNDVFGIRDNNRLETTSSLHPLQRMIFTFGIAPKSPNIVSCTNDSHYVLDLSYKNSSRIEYDIAALFKKGAEHFGTVGRVDSPLSLATVTRFHNIQELVVSKEVQCVSIKGFPDNLDLAVTNVLTTLDNGKTYRQLYCPNGNIMRGPNPRVFRYNQIINDSLKAITTRKSEINLTVPLDMKKVLAQLIDLLKQKNMHSSDVKVLANNKFAKGLIKDHMLEITQKLISENGNKREIMLSIIPRAEMIDEYMRKKVLESLHYQIVSERESYIDVYQRILEAIIETNTFKRLFSLPEKIIAIQRHHTAT